jgi:deoxyribose-phosphate aldolase
MTLLNSKTITFEQLARTIDHSLLRPEMTEAEVVSGCLVALKYHTASVCVKPCHVKIAAQVLTGTDVRVGVVIGFPHGSNLTVVKVYEANAAMDDGAVELDMVLNIGALRGGQMDLVCDDIRAVVKVAHARGALVKVILENAYLSEEQKVLACQLCEQAGADFVKTSTGFAPTGATVADIQLMRASVGSHVQVKAAGGVRTLDAALAVIDAGVTRVGATATAAILEEFRTRTFDAHAEAPGEGAKKADLGGGY